MKFPEQTCIQYPFQPEYDRRGTTTHKKKNTQETWHSSRLRKNRRRGNMTEIQCHHTRLHAFTKSTGINSLAGFGQALDRTVLGALLKHPGGRRGSSRDPTEKVSVSLSLFLTPSSSLSSSPCGSHSSFLSLWFLSNTFKLRHMHVSTVFGTGSSSQTC